MIEVGDGVAQTASPSQYESKVLALNINDCSYNIVLQVPLFDSYVVFNAVQRRDFGGRDLTACSSNNFSERAMHLPQQRDGLTTPRPIWASFFKKSLDIRRRLLTRCGSLIKLIFSVDECSLFAWQCTAYPACPAYPAYPASQLQVWWTQLQTVKE